MKKRPIKYSQDELAWIEAHSTDPRREAHALFVQIWNRADVSLDNFGKLCRRKGWHTGRDGHYVKGVRRSDNPSRKGHHYAGVEKGWFRKGTRQGAATHLYQPIGTERVTRDGYRERKINDDQPMRKRWRAVHLIEWEAVNGPLPVGYALKCLDGDRTNTAPSNWVCIPRALLPRLNGVYGRGYDTAPAELKPAILAVAKLEHAAREARKPRKEAAE